MTLIDSLGDIIWKARQAAGVSLEAAARAGDLSPALLEQLERTGQCDSPINIPKLAPVIGLNPRGDKHKPRYCAECDASGDALDRVASAASLGEMADPRARICPLFSLRREHTWPREELQGRCPHACGTPMMTS